MKNNIKKARVKFREDLLYFQLFMLILSLPQISDYHHFIKTKILQYDFFSLALIDRSCQAWTAETSEYVPSFKYILCS